MHSDLSDNQKRFTCRVLFLVLCAVPTCVTIYAATHKRTPNQWAQIIQAELGVQTSIGAVDTPKPDELVIRELILYDNNSEPIFEALGAKITFGPTNEIEFRSSIPIELSKINHIVNEAAERLVKPRANAKLWKISFQDVTVLGDHEGEQFQGSLDAEWFSDPRGGVVRMKWPLKSRGKQYENFAGLTIARNGTEGVKVDIESPHGFMPCWFARRWFPELEPKLGRNALFAGFAKIESVDSKTSCQLTGEFRQIQLSNLPGIDPRNARLATAIRMNQLELEDAHWKNGNADLKVAGAFVVMDNQDYGQPSVFADVMRRAIERTAYREDFKATLKR